MKCLTIKQPHASLIMAGIKRYEFRTWKPSQDVIGQTIAIHAAASSQYDAEEVLQDWKLKHVRRAILGTVRLDAVFLLGRKNRGKPTVKSMMIAADSEPPEVRYDDFLTPDKEGRWVWALSRPVLFPTPRPFVGRLGLFDVLL